MRQWSVQAFGFCLHVGLARVAEVAAASEPADPEPAAVEPDEPRRRHFDWQVPADARVTVGEWPRTYEDPDIAAD